MILVSACLLGINTRYDGKNSRNQKVIECLHELEEPFLPVCPEQLGGLPTPRNPTHLQKSGEMVLDKKSKAIMSDGTDVSENFRRGAKETLKLAEEFGADRAILKSDSPSCGVYRVSKSLGKKEEGKGVTAALLSRNGIELMTEKDL